MTIGATYAATAHEGREPAGKAGDPVCFVILLDPHNRSYSVVWQGRNGLHQEPRKLLG